MKNKLLWFFQEVDEPEPQPVEDPNKPGPSRSVLASSSSKTPQGKHAWSPWNLYEEVVCLWNQIDIPHL